MVSPNKKKIKVGILTFHRAHNYGAVLQCYALQETLKSLGYDACVIDYRQAVVEAPYHIISLRVLLGGKFREIQGHIRHIPSRIVRRPLFAEFVRKHLHLSVPCHSAIDIPPLDAYVIGSDQMWNFKLTGGQDSVYIGKFDRPVSSYLCGYAISTNTKSLQDMADDDLRSVCSHFTYLSFREHSYAQMVSKRTGHKINVDIDPTLLMGREFWERLTNQRFVNRRYVLLYQVRKPQSDRNVLNRKAKYLAKQMNCEVIDASNAKFSPEDFVSLFRYAQFIVTSSFHATAFSVIFERQLYAVRLCDGHDARYENLLKDIGAERLLVNTDFEPRQVSFDYAEARTRLCNMRRQSLNRLNEALSH